MIIKNVITLLNGFSNQLQFCENLNPFWPNVPFLYPLKTSENLWYRNRTLG